MKSLSIVVLILLTLSACNTVQKAEEMSVRKGEITVAVDESFRYIAKAEIEAYKAHYPETKFNIIYTPEQKAIGLLLSDSAELAIVSRELSENEQRYFTSRKLDYQPGKMALDAITLVVNRDSDLDQITQDEIGAIMKGEPSKRKLVFDNSSSSNLNFMLSYFNIQNLNQANIFAANGTEDVFSYLENNNDAIGVIGLNWISDDDDKRAKELKERIKIVAVENESSQYVLPTAGSLRRQEYPLMKIVYLHTTQERWGVAKGFVRFACSQIGQLVVEKMGLQPYYLIPKHYQMNGKPYIPLPE